MISVGLELAGNSIKVAVLDGGRGKPKLKSFDVRRIDAKKGEAEDDIVSVVDETLKRMKAPRNNVVCSVRAQECMIREIIVPFLEDDKIRKTVKYQAENYFTSMSIDDLIIDYSKFAEVDTKSKLLVCGIKKSHVDRRLRFLDECKIDPAHIDMDVAALYNTYAHLGLFEEVGAALIVEIEAETLKIGIVEEGRLRLARAIRMRLGSMKLETARKKPSGMDSGIYDTAADDSARLPVVILDEGDDEAFSLEDSGISETEREGILHRVFMEIDRTVAAVQLNHEVDQIYLTGASCQLDGIEVVFSDHFEIEARRVDISSEFSAKAQKPSKTNPGVSLAGATAVGLALKGLGIDHAGMDFRQEEFLYKGTFAQLRRGLACMLTLLFTLVFLYAFNLKQELRERKAALQGIQTMQRNLYTVLFPNLDNQPDKDGEVKPHAPLKVKGKYYESLKAEKRRLQNTYKGDTGSGQTVSALEILRQFAIAKSKVDKRWGIEVMKVGIDPRPGGRSRFNCKCADQPAPIELARKFEKNETGLEGLARETRPPKRGDSGWTFEFLIQKPQERR